MEFPPPAGRRCAAPRHRQGSRVAFSDVALVTDVRGTPTITFRIVNERPFSCLFDVTCRVSALVKDPKAGMRTGPGGDERQSFF